MKDDRVERLATTGKAISISLLRRRIRSLLSVACCASYDRAGMAPPAPLMVYVELTRRCNLRCRHCDIWMTAARRPGAEKAEVSAAVLVDNLREMAGHGLVAVDLFGGEPLLRGDLPQIVADLRAQGLHVTVTTNGTLLTRDLSRDLVASGVSQLLVSIDAPEAPVHDRLRGRSGAFEQAVAGLATFVSEATGRVRPGVNALVCRENLGLLARMPAFAAALGATQLRLLPYHQCYPFNEFRQGESLAPAAEDLPALRSALRELAANARRAGVATNSPSYLDGIAGWYAGHPPRVRCMAGLGVCDINGFGDLYPCYTLGKSAGNIGQRRALELWRSAWMDEHRKGTRGCAACWQSCYIEPGLRLSPRALLRDRHALWRDIREYFA